MRPNVLQLIASFDQGGSERQAVQLVRLLHESGLAQVHVACLKGGGVLASEVLRLGLGPVPEFPLSSFYDRNALRQLKRFRSLLSEREIDVVQTHDFYTNVFGMAGAWMGRVPARVASKRETHGMRTPAQKLVERQVFRLAHRVVVNSEAVGRQLVSDGVRASKLVTVYNGLDASRVTPAAGLTRDAMLGSLELPREESRRFVTIVANLEHEVKDHATFLRAAARVSACVPEAAFVLAGEGRLAEDLRRQAAELGVGRDTFFTGRCTRVAELLSVSDVCVLSSRAEGFSNSILEYMAAGRPVVVTDVGGAREAVTEGETGYLVSSGDDRAMAARIVSLLTEPERARAMGERGRQTIELKFSCEAQLKNTLSLYDELLSRTRPARSRAMEDAPHKGV